MIKDPIFGEMVYDYSWEKKEECSIFGREIELGVVAKAYRGQEILNVQRDAYVKYKENITNYMMRVPEVLLQYYLDNYEQIASTIEIPDKINKENINKELIVKLIRVNTLYIDRKGRYGWLCDCAWDNEHGICILLSNGISIVEQDYLL
jgi:hypothetical protein